MIFNKDKETRKLEKEAYKLDPQETEYLNKYYHNKLNNRTMDMSIYCYEYNLKAIIKAKKEQNNVK